MAEPSIDIQRIVREVLAELGAASSDQQAACPAPSEPVSKPVSKPVVKPTPTDNRELVVTARVVTTADIDNRLGGIRRVIVDPRAVVTPSVRDLLRASNVTLVRSQSSPDVATTDACKVRLILATLGKSFDSTGLIGALRDEGINVDSRSSDCVITTSNEMAAELTDGRTLGVVLTARPAIVMCCANRLPGVRAVLATDAATTAKDTASVGANLLVISPRKVNFFMLKQLIRDFLAGGVRECPGPEELIKLLG